MLIKQSSALERQCRLAMEFCRETEKMVRRLQNAFGILNVVWHKHELTSKSHTAAYKLIYKTIAWAKRNKFV